MSELLKAFDSYNEFEKTSYFTLLFNVLPSNIAIDVPLEESKDNLEHVLNLIDTSSNNFSIVFKNWNTEDSKDSDFNRDFPFELLYKSENKKSIIWISLENDTLSVVFYYDCKDIVLEEWIIATNHKLRKKFGLSRTPVFKVLSKEHGSFHTQDVRTEKIAVNIEMNYNEDFKEIHQKIDSSITSKNSGLILLYGNPGTGKTTYIKNLISKHRKSNFIFIQNEFVNNLLDPDFISFLLKQRNAILVIEDAEKVIASRDQFNEASVVSTILQLTDGLFSDYLNIKIICTFNTNISKIDTALLRKGRMIAMYEFKPLNLEKTNHLLKSIGENSSKEALTISDIFNNNEDNYANISKSKIGF